MCARVLAEELERLVGLLDRVADQTKRRVIDGEKVPAGEKVVSIFECHTDIIEKGNRETVYGHKLFLTGGQSGLVMDCVIQRGNPADATLFIPLLERQAELFQRPPRQVAADGGFVSVDNLRQAKQLGVTDVSFSKRKGLSVLEMVKSSWVYKKLRNFPGRDRSRDLRSEAGLRVDALHLVGMGRILPIRSQCHRILQRDVARETHDFDVLTSAVHYEYLGGYLGPFRLLLSDLVVLTMAGSPQAGPENLLSLKSHVQRFRGDARLIVTDFEPQPLGDVRGKDVFFTTTAPGAVAARQIASLESAHGCRVVGWSTSLADRAGLAKDMDGAEEYEVLLTELKAAAVDVACRRATSRGAEVVFVDNRAVVVEGEADLPAALEEAIELAMERNRSR